MDMSRRNLPRLSAGAPQLSFVVGVLLFLAGCGLIVAHAAVYNWLEPFAGRYLGKDARFELSGARNMARFIYTAGSLGVLAGALVLAARQPVVRRILQRSLFTDQACGARGVTCNPAAVLISSAVIGTILSALYILRGFLSLVPLYEEDGPFENVSTALFIISGLLLWVAAYRLRRSKAPTGQVDGGRRLLTAGYGLAGLASFVVGMEEISWGQRIFGWATPAALYAVNTQGESNFHNIINPYFDVLYVAFGIAFFLLLLLGWYLQACRPGSIHSLIFPHPSLILLGVLVLLFSSNDQAELVEELLSVFAFFYTLRVLMIALPRRTTFGDTARPGTSPQL